MTEKLWLFHEHCGGGKALFTTEKAALLFKNAVDKKLIELGETSLDSDEFDIQEVEINPDFETWWNS